LLSKKQNPARQQNKKYCGLAGMNGVNRFTPGKLATDDNKAMQTGQ
jgi:hypothetical protein